MYLKSDVEQQRQCFSTVMTTTITTTRKALILGCTDYFAVSIQVCFSFILLGLVFTARRSYASAVLRVVILSVRRSVTCVLYD